MSMWTAIFGIVAISCIAGAISSYFKAQGRAAGRRDRNALDSRLGAAESANRELEERVRTLERIVTDGRYHLNREIESLER